MNENLRNTIHRYAEDREIDYISARVIGEQNGLTFKNEGELSAWKQTIDRYLKTFDSSAWQDIENYLA